MSRADLEAAAEEEYPFEHLGYSQPVPVGCLCDECYVRAQQRAAYIRGRLDQAEADARIAESLDFGPDGPPLHQASRHRWGAKQAAAAIRKGVQ